MKRIKVEEDGRVVGVKRGSVNSVTDEVDKRVTQIIICTCIPFRPSTYSTTSC